jgi:membrane protein YqaA with SNARE-associated domain
MELSDTKRGWGPHAVAAAWGFGEATLFFFVPDVVLTWFALDHPRRTAYAACAWAVAGALLGGTAMYAWGATDFPAAAGALDAVPAVSAIDVVEVREELDTGGLAALFLGPLTAKPYKIYAVQSGATGLSLLAFLLISIPARGIRFVLLTAFARAVVHITPARRWSLGVHRAIHATLWVAFYAVFWSLKSW